MDRVVEEGIEYVKAGVAAKQLKYTKDYIGQLCRAGKVNARMVGRSWYVDIESLKSHKESRYGDIKGDKTHVPGQNKPSELRQESLKKNIISDKHYYAALSYEDDKADLFPQIKKRSSALTDDEKVKDKADASTPVHQVAVKQIKVLVDSQEEASPSKNQKESKQKELTIDTISEEEVFTPTVIPEKPRSGILKIIEEPDRVLHTADAEEAPEAAKSDEPAVKKRVVTQKQHSKRVTVPVGKRESVVQAAQKTIGSESTAIKSLVSVEETAPASIGGSPRLVTSLVAAVLLMAAFVVPFISWQTTVDDSGNQKNVLSVQVAALPFVK